MNFAQQFGDWIIADRRRAVAVLGLLAFSCVAGVLIVVLVVWKPFASAEPTPTGTPTSAVEAAVTAMPSFTPVAQAGATPAPTARPMVTEAPGPTPTPAPVGIATIDGDVVNLRAGHSTDDEVVDQSQAGDTFPVYARTADGEWLQIDAAGGLWVFAALTSLDVELGAVPVAGAEPVVPAPVGAVVTATVTINGDVVNLRAGPGTDYEIVNQSRQGDVFTVYARTPDGEWLQIDAAGELWVFAELATLDVAVEALLVAGAEPVVPGPTATLEPTATLGPTATLTETLEPTATLTGTLPAAAPTQPTETEITLIGLTSPIGPGAEATLEIEVVPGVVCDPGVIYQSEALQAEGLQTQVAGEDGRLVWTWTVSNEMTPGTWVVYVNCKPGGLVQWPFVVQQPSGE